MKNLIACLIIVAFLFSNANSQNNTEKIVSIHQTQTFRLVSKGHAMKPLVTSKPRLVLDVVLPDNTIRWFYSIVAKRSKEEIEQAKSKIKLFSQLTRVVDQSGTTANAIPLLISPPGDHFCDVYVLSSYNDALKFGRSSDDFSYLRNGSRKSIKSGITEISNPEYCQGTQYIGISNPDWKWGVSVAIEVTAIVSTEWLTEDKQAIFGRMYNLFVGNGLLKHFTEEEVEELTACFINRITTEYTFQEFAAKANFEIEPIAVKIIEECGVGLGFDKKLEKNPTQEQPENYNTTPCSPTRQLITGSWKDENSFFTMNKDGTFHISWDNEKSASGNWDFQNNSFYFKFEGSKSWLENKLISFSKDKMVFQTVGDGMVYTAMRLKK